MPLRAPRSTPAPHPEAPLDRGRSSFGALLGAALLLALGACDPAGIEPSPALGDPLPGLTDAELARFETGKAFFTRVWTEDEGLGPVYNESACNACHSDPEPGGGGGEETDEKVTIWDGARCDLLLEEGGGNVRQQVTALAATHGLTPEDGPGGARGYFTSPLLYGRGLVEAIPDETLLALADPEDADGDGISGRVGRDADGRVARFLRKASVATLHDASAGSLVVEIGLTTPYSEEETVFLARNVPEDADPTADPEVGTDVVEAIADFMRFLAPPAPALPDDAEALAEVATGERLFQEVGCAECHRPALFTGEHAVEALSRKRVALYSDLLLHDMGAELADICGPGATPSELRTEILMGLGLRSRFMHDGTSSTLWDAIARHGGEGAPSRAAFDALSELQRHAVIAFLRTL